jgi:predicted Zn-dependent protease
MQRKYPLILVFLTALNLLAHAALAAELLKVSRIDSKDIVQLYFSFDVTPEYTSISSDRRIDLEFYKTTCSPSLFLGEADGDIVKILPRREENRFILSLFFRYRPQNYTLTKSLDGKLVFEVLLGNEYSKSYQNLADRLSGLTVLERISADSTNPYLSSPYTKDWMSFFSQYEAPIKIDVPVTFSLPPFPAIGLLPPGGKKNIQLLNAEMILLAEQNLWQELAEKLMAAVQTTEDTEEKKLLALTCGEALSRSGNFADAYRQFFQLQEQYGDELVGIYAKYLLAQLRAVYESPYIAASDYGVLASSISNNLPLAPYFLLSQIETALATKNYKHLNHLLLRDDVPLPKEIAEIVQIRQADYWSAINKPIKAKAAYKIQADSPLLATLPYSLAETCNISYEQRKFAESEKCYETLSTMVLDTNLLGLIDYRKNMAKLHVSNGNPPIDEFADIEKEYPETEAGFRASIKRNDLLFLQNKSWGPEAIRNYGKIAQQANSRSIREEVLFKRALIHAILGETMTSIELLQRYLREFLIGDVRISAQALLIELLPVEIKRLVDNQEYMQPLVLAKKNKDLFQNKWIDSTFLTDIAEAYNRIGIYDEAQKIYLYLIGISPVDQKEQFFLPMIQATFDSGNFSLVEDYAAQYAYTYPTGVYRQDILKLRLQSLVSDERLNDALNLLPAPLPDDIALYELALPLYFRTDNYEKCLEVSRKLAFEKKSLSQRELFMSAESLYQAGMTEEAETLFATVTRENDFYEQSMYRLAELARMQGDEKKALSFFGKLVETEKNSLWKQYAERELQFAKAAARN